MVVNTELLLLLVQVNISGLSKKLLALCYKLLFCLLDVHMQNTSRVLKYGLGLCSMCQQKYILQNHSETCTYCKLVYLIHNEDWKCSHMQGWSMFN